MTVSSSLGRGGEGRGGAVRARVGRPEGEKGKGAPAPGGERKLRGLEGGGRAPLRQEAILPQEMKEGEPQRGPQSWWTRVGKVVRALATRAFREPRRDQWTPSEVQ